MIKLDLDPAPHVVRQFAWIALFGVPLLAWMVLNLSVGFAWDHPAFLACVAVGVVQLVLLLLGLPFAARALFVLLSVVAVPIGIVVSNLLLALIYYLVITPIGLVFRLIGRDVLGKRPDPELASYWHVRGGPRPKSSYFKLY